MAFLDSVKNLMKFNKNNETKQKNDVSTVEKSYLSDKNKEPITKVGHNATLIIIYQDDRGQSLTYFRIYWRRTSFKIQRISQL